MPAVGSCGLGLSHCRVVLKSNDEKNISVQTTRTTLTAGDSLNRINSKEFPKNSQVIHFECYEHIRDRKLKNSMAWAALKSKC